MKRFRSVLFIVLGLFLVLMSVILVNSFLAKSKQISAIADEYQVSDAAVERLSKAITYKTITPAIPENRESLEFIKFQAFIDSCFPNVSAQLLKESFGLSLLY